MPMFNPNAPIADFEQQAQVAQQSRILADLLRKKALAEGQPEGKMVGGQYIKPHFLERLVPIMNAVNAGWAGNQATEDEQTSNNMQNQAAEQWRNSAPQAIPGEAFQPGMPDVPGQDGGYAAAPAIPERPVTEAQVLKHTLAGMAIPKAAKEAVLYNTTAQRSLDREDKQKEVDRLARTAAVDKAEAAKLKAEEEMKQLELRLADTKLSREDKAKLEAERLAAEARWRTAHDDTLAAIAAGNNATRRAIHDATAPKPPKPLPAAQSKAWVENNIALKQLDRAEAAIKDYPQGVGVSRGLPNALGAKIGGVINNNLDPKGTAVRAIIADIGSLKVHDRSGAAVTAAEEPRLIPFIPTVYDNADTIKKKLAQFRNHYMDTQSSILDYANAQGYKSPEGSKPGSNFTIEEVK